MITCYYQFLLLLVGILQSMTGSCPADTQLQSYAIPSKIYKSGLYSKINNDQIN